MDMTEPSLIPQTALIADDNEEMGFVIQCMLEMMDFTVERARDGREALAMSNARLYSLILMDIEMPLMDGLSTTRAIRSHETADHMSPVKIIGITSHKDLGTRRLCQLAGMDDVLSKPFLMEQLQQKLVRPQGAAIN